MRYLKCAKLGCEKPCITVEDGAPLCEDHCEGWLTQNLRDPEFSAAYQRECEKDAAIAAAKEAVAQAAWADWRAGLITLDTETYAACAALDKLIKE